MALPAPKPVVSQGGHDQSVNWSNKPIPMKKVKKPRIVSVAPAEDPIMAMFHSTLAEINKVATPVDATSLRAPYDLGATAATGIAAGAAAADHANSVRTSQQYGTAADEAAQHAASFGIANGAGAGTARPDDTQALLAQQDQAQQNASIGAGTAWAQLLNRIATATVGKATRERQAGIDSQSMALAAGLPGMYSAQATAQETHRKNTLDSQYLAKSLGLKRDEFLQHDATTRRGQDVTTAGQETAVTIAGSNADAAMAREVAREKAAATRQAKHDKATIAGQNKRAAMTAKNNGGKGLPGQAQALAAIKPVAVDGYSGWDVVTQRVSGTTPYGSNSPVTWYGDKRVGVPHGVPEGFRVVSAHPHVVKGQRLGVTLAQWNRAVGIMRTSNPGMSQQKAEEIVSFWQSRPPK